MAQTRGKPPPSPYSIFCVRPWDLHPNGFLSRDSQGGVLKLSRFGLLGLWEFITPSSDLWLGWGLKQRCSFPQELSKGVLHSTCTHRDQVDSRLLVVGSQTTSLIPDPSFDHNFCCICLNDLCEAILDIYISKPFQWCKEHLNAKIFWPLQSSFEFLRVLEDSKFPLLGVWVSSSHLVQSGVATP
jgi:hypothetical protein